MSVHLHQQEMICQMALEERHEEKGYEADEEEGKG